MKYMIIDDEKAVSDVISYFMLKEQIPLEIAEIVHDGKRGKIILDTDTPHLVFIDIQMPYFNGLELMELFPQHKYIVITAFDLFQYAKKALQLGAIDYLLKPIRKEDLLTAIQRAVGHRYYRDEIADSIQHILQTQFSTRITLSDIANQLGYHPAYIARHYKKVTGSTVMEQLAAIRMQEAKILLQTTSDSVQQIAEQCGYVSESSFYRDFKKTYGITPFTMRTGK